MAKRFHFRLDPLLKLRKKQEEEAQRALARAIEARQAQEAKLHALEEEHTRTLEYRRQSPGAEIDLSFWAHLERYLLVLEKRMIQAQEALRQAEQAVQEARAALALAHQNHMMLVRLKERRREQHEQDILHEEIREADELSILRFRPIPHFASSSVSGGAL